TGGLSSSRVCGKASRSARTTPPPRSTRSSTSVRTRTRSAVAPGACAAPAAGTPAGATGTLSPAGASGTVAGVDAGAPGTVPAASPASAAAGAASGARCSLPHSSQSRVATISQAKIRKVRVWFIGQEHSFAGGTRRQVGIGGSGGHCDARFRRGQRAAAPERVVEGLAQGDATRLRGGRAGDEHVGAIGQAGAQFAEGFAQRALDAVAADRAAVDLARDRQAQAGGTAVAEQVQGEQRGAGAATLGKDPVEVRAHADARLAGQAAVHGIGIRGGAAAWAARGHQALRRLRPLARRRARILRPSAVAMRARKPWSRLRLRLLGWKVRLVAMAWARVQ